MSTIAFLFLALALLAVSCSARKKPKPVIDHARTTIDPIASSTKPAHADDAHPQTGRSADLSSTATFSRESSLSELSTQRTESPKSGAERSPGDAPVPLFSTGVTAAPSKEAPLSSLVNFSLVNMAKTFDFFLRSGSPVVPVASVWLTAAVASLSVRWLL